MFTQPCDDEVFRVDREERNLVRRKGLSERGGSDLVTGGRGKSQLYFGCSNIATEYDDDDEASSR